jgi:DNA-directed RNA polymerase
MFVAASMMVLVTRMSAEVRLVQLVNALLPMLVTPFPIVTEVRLEQL